MKSLKRKYFHNGLCYNLLQRNAFVAIYGINGTDRKNMSMYKVGRIDVYEDNGIKKEYVPNDEYLKRYSDYETAINYFYSLTEDILFITNKALKVNGSTKIITEEWK